MEISEIKVSYSSSNENKCKISNSDNAYEVIKAHWDLDVIQYQEEVKIILLSRSNVVLGVFNLSKGGTVGCVVDVKIVLAVSLKCNAHGIILVHNHPSGNLEPSEADNRLTNKLKSACEIVDITLLDHLIISLNGYWSYKDETSIL